MAEQAADPVPVCKIKSQGTGELSENGKARLDAAVADMFGNNDIKVKSRLKGRQRGSAWTVQMMWYWLRDSTYDRSRHSVKWVPDETNYMWFRYPKSLPKYLNPILESNTPLVDPTVMLMYGGGFRLPLQTQQLYQLEQTFMVVRGEVSCRLYSPLAAHVKVTQLRNFLGFRG
jgi:hypothetical protein